MFDWSPFVDVAEVKSIEEKEEEFNNVVSLGLQTLDLYFCVFHHMRSLFSCNSVRQPLQNRTV